MKAVICTRYGSPDVLQLQEVEKPSPCEDEVLIRIHAASINARDWRLMRAKPFFVRLMPGNLLHPKNRVLGVDFAGIVEATGYKVGQIKPGDEVFGFMPSASGRGTFAEYVCAKENLITLKPANLTFDQAAAVPLAAMTAWQGLRDKGNIQPGQRVLINGASGGVGTFAVQIAKSFGAEVTAVCSMKHLEMARSLGADHIIDRTVDDFTRNGQKYDLILAVNGYHPINDYLRALNQGGSYVVAGGSMRQLIQAVSSGQHGTAPGRQTISILSMQHNRNDLVLIKELIEAGKIKPVIDRCYPLAKTPEAFRYFENEHPSGKIAIEIISPIL
jgi:NADPH:quinone reductase-like Zn-dependent oxidoreductase